MEAGDWVQNYYYAGGINSSVPWHRRATRVNNNIYVFESKQKREERNWNASTTKMINIRGGDHANYLYLITAPCMQALVAGYIGTSRSQGH